MYPVAVALRKKLPKLQNQPQGRLLTFQGETMNETQWAKRLGCSRQALHSRLKKMSVEQVLAMPAGNRLPLGRAVEMPRLQSPTHSDKMSGLTARHREPTFHGRQWNLRLRQDSDKMSKAGITPSTGDANDRIGPPRNARRPVDAIGRLT